MFFTFPSKIFINNPWFSFPIFLATLTLLSYSPFCIQQCFQYQIALAILGLVLPWLFLRRASSSQAGRFPPPTENFFLPGSGVFLILSAALILRLWRINSLSVWPMPDDGLYSYYAMSLSKKWQWNFFFSYTQEPPFAEWLLALFYKAIPPSFLSLHLLPALVSFLTVVVGWAGARKFFPPLTSFYLLFFLAFNFAFIYPAQFSFWAYLMLFFTVVSLLFLGISAKGRPEETGQALFLGIIAGLGFFTGTGWPIVALSITIAAFYIFKGERRRLLWIYLAPFSIGAFLFCFAALREGYGSHIRSVGFSTFSWSPFLDESVKKIASLFWYSPDPSAYGPLWGGMLDPVAGAFFLTGLTSVWRRKREPFHRWLLLSLGLFILPGLAAKGFEIFRNVQVIPLLALVSALGFQELWVSWPFKRPATRGWVMAIILAVSASMSLHHLNGPYHDLWGKPGPFWKNIKSVELYEAYEILEKVRAEKGPGAVLEDLRPNPNDVTLATAVYAYDASNNPSIKWKDVHWVAVLANANYKPFLEARFPTGRWYWLNKEGATNNQPWMLGVIPLDSSHEKEMARWMDAERGFQSFTAELMESFQPSVRAGLEGKLLSLYPLMKGDPFLESCFWEKMIFLAKMNGDDKKASKAVQQALAHGYPLPHLLDDQGVLMERVGRYGEAIKDFKRAIKTPLDLSNAKEDLDELEQKISNNKRSQSRNHK